MRERERERAMLFWRRREGPFTPIGKYSQIYAHTYINIAYLKLQNEMYCCSCLGVYPAEKVSITRVSGWTRMKSKQTNPFLCSLNKQPANDRHRYLCDCHACVSDVCSPFPESWTFNWDDRSETDLPNIISDRLALKMWTCSPFQLHIHTWKKWAFFSWAKGNVGRFFQSHGS